MDLSFTMRRFGRAERGWINRLVVASCAVFTMAIAGASAACAPKDFNNAKFTVCTFDPRHDDIRLFLTGPDDKPYGSLSALASALKAKGEKLAFAMNAGMFGEDQLPVGLYVEDKRKLH